MSDNSASCGALNGGSFHSSSIRSDARHAKCVLNMLTAAEASPRLARRKRVAVEASVLSGMSWSNTLVTARFSISSSVSGSSSPLPLKDGNHDDAFALEDDAAAPSAK